MKAPDSGIPAINRRRFVQAAVVAATGATGATGSLAWAPADAAAARGEAGNGPAAVPPMPIPGGLVPMPGKQIHVFLPGNPSVTLPFSHSTLMGFDVEPSTITDRMGFSAVAYHTGTATGSDGVTYNLEIDVRGYAGQYVAADGMRRFGKFALI